MEDLNLTDVWATESNKRELPKKKKHCRRQTICLVNLSTLKIFILIENKWNWAPFNMTSDHMWIILNSLNCVWKDNTRMLGVCDSLSCREASHGWVDLCYGAAQQQWYQRCSAFCFQNVLCSSGSTLVEVNCGAGEHSLKLRTTSKTKTKPATVFKSKFTLFCMGQRSSITHTVSASCLNHWLLKHSNCSPRK